MEASVRRVVIAMATLGREIDMILDNGSTLSISHFKYNLQSNWQMSWYWFYIIKVKPELPLLLKWMQIQSKRKLKLKSQNPGFVVPLVMFRHCLYVSNSFLTHDQRQYNLGPIINKVGCCTILNSYIISYWLQRLNMLVEQSVYYTVWWTICTFEVWAFSPFIERMVFYLPGIDSGGRKRESQATITNSPDGR